MHDATTSEKKQSLELHLNTLFRSVRIDQRRYFHTRSIENFIVHFDNIKYEKDKNWIFETLSQYLDACGTVTTNVEKDISKHLFMEYLDKVAHYYRDHLGFKIMLNRPIVYVIYVFVMVLLNFVFNFYAVLPLIALCAYQTITVNKKIRQKKVYSLFW